MIKIKKITNYNGMNGVIMTKKDFINFIELLTRYSKYEHIVDFEEVE